MITVKPSEELAKRFGLGAHAIIQPIGTRGYSIAVMDAWPHRAKDTDLYSVCTCAVTSISPTDHSVVLLEGLGYDQPDLGLAAAEELFKHCGVRVLLYLVVSHQKEIFNLLVAHDYKELISFKNLVHGSEGRQIRLMAKLIQPIDNQQYWDSNPVWKSTADNFAHYHDYIRYMMNDDFVIYKHTTYCCGAMCLSDLSPKGSALYNEIFARYSVPFLVALAETPEKANTFASLGGVPVVRYDGKSVYAIIRDVPGYGRYWENHKIALANANVLE